MHPIFTQISSNDRTPFPNFINIRRGEWCAGRWTRWSKSKWGKRETNFWWVWWSAQASQSKSLPIFYRKRTDSWPITTMSCKCSPAQWRRDYLAQETKHFRNCVLALRYTKIFEKININDSTLNLEPRLWLCDRHFRCKQGALHNHWTVDGGHWRTVEGARGIFEGGVFCLATIWFYWVFFSEIVQQLTNPEDAEERSPFNTSLSCLLWSS